MKSRPVFMSIICVISIKKVNVKLRSGQVRSGLSRSYGRSGQVWVEGGQVILRPTDLCRCPSCVASISERW